ncbi:HET-domain-containing protein, partial [Saccharata proteae CBS 121410]
MSFFVYRALTPDQRRIRLVHLLPQRSDSPGENSNEPLSQEAELHQDSKVSCTLSHASLDQPPDYRALSYTWGDPNDVGSITVDGDSFQVRKSLEIALRQLMCDQPLTLWIDALCIDQDDEIEKTEQVRQMEQIYRRANSVITWLGPGTKESDAVMHWIQRHGALIEDEGLREFLRDVSSRLTPGVSESDDVIVAVREFFKRPYWSRVWVVQELAHAKAVEFVCGKENVSEEVLHHALRLLRNFADYQYIKEAHQPRSISSNAAVASFSTRNAISLLKIRRAAGPFPLIHLIRTLKFCRATDPRDKIFALLSFASDAVALDLSPDYQKTINEVYVKATASLIRHGYFDILTLSETRKKVPNLPSWVPDF